MANCTAQGQVHGAEAEWRRRDERIVKVKVHLRRVSIPNHPESIEFIAEDVTELRAMERQLRQAQKFEAIGQLAGGIAHDFNNVIGAILGWAELGYEQNRTNMPTAERFARIREQAERGAALTRELLAFARHQVLQPRAVDVNTVAGGLASFLDKVIGKDIEFKVITAPVDPVKADPTQLEQVLMNLCLNARDAMPGGGRLLIETEMVELDDSYCGFYPYVSPGRYAVLSVSDTGVGMDGETRERIFEPFFTTKERGKGTGIGLATVYGIVKQSGGHITVYTEVGVGTTFKLYLPLVGERSRKMQPEIAVSELPHGTETILLVEDADPVRALAREVLQRSGYTILEARHGLEALVVAEQFKGKIDLLVTDVVMPQMGGPELAKLLRDARPGTKVLYLSGYTDDAVFRHGLLEGETAFVQKPFAMAVLARKVREVLDRELSSLPHQ
jgi:signal transduction histidine kinase/CheY-like chemotaxis protein